MAENKKSFVAYCDWQGIFDMLTDQEAGILVKHLFAYVNDESPILEDRVLKMAFESIKSQLKRDLNKYKGELEKKSLSGRIGNLKRWNIDIYNEFMGKKITLEEAEKIAEHRKTSQCDFFIANIADNDNVNDNVNDIININNSKSHCVANAPLPKKINQTQSASSKNSKKIEKEKKVAPKKEKATEHWKSLLNVWFNFYKTKFAIEPTFNAGQGKILKTIIENCYSLSQKMDQSQSKEFAWTEDRAVRVFTKFLENAWSDKWLREHFLLKNLMSNFDAITNQIAKQTPNETTKPPTYKKQFRFSTAQAIETITGGSQ